MDLSLEFESIIRQSPFFVYVSMVSQTFSFTEVQLVTISLMIVLKSLRYRLPGVLPQCKDYDMSFPEPKGIATN